MADIGQLFYRDWNHLKRDFIADLFPAGQPFTSGIYLFRGCGDADWHLVSAFDRRFGQLATKRRLDLWGDLLRSFRSACAEHGVPSSVLDDDRQLLAFGQHYGLPTRLLDWSLSPYIAAFFAFRQAMSMSATARDVAVWVLDTRSDAWSAEIGVEIVSPPALDNLRLRNQVGRFTLARTRALTLEEHVRGCDAVGFPLIKAVLPASEARRALPDLDAMGVTPTHLFPDVTGIIEGVTLRLEASAATDPDIGSAA